MKSFLKFLAAGLISLASTAQAQIDTRTNTLSLVNNTGKLVLSYNGTAPGSFTFPEGNSMAIGEGTAWQTLAWVSGQWQPMSNVLNDGTGLFIDGNLTVTTGTITGNGLNITSLDASNISVGTLSLDRISTTGASANQMLVYNGSVLTYDDIPTVSNLDASAITSGTLGDAYLSTNIPRLDEANVFTASVNSFNLVEAAAFSGNGEAITDLDAGKITNGQLILDRISTEDAEDGQVLMYEASVLRYGYSTSLLIDANNITEGTLDDARLSPNVALLNEDNLFDAADNTFTGVVSATEFSGDGSDIYDLNADSFASGTMADDYLSSNVPLLNQYNIFTNDNVFEGSVYADYFTGDGSSIQNLNASNITDGTLNDSRLSINVVLEDKANRFDLVSTFNDDIIAEDIYAEDIQGYGTNIMALDADNISYGTLDLSNISIDGAAPNQVLMFDGSNLIYTDFEADINADNIASGTLSDERLSDNIPRLDVTNRFSSDIITSGVVEALYFEGSGVSLYDLDAGAINAGTLDDMHLSPNVPLLDAVSNFFMGDMDVDQTLYADWLVGDGLGITNLDAANITNGKFYIDRIATDGASQDQVLMFDGSGLVYADLPDGGDGFSIPFAETGAHMEPMLALTNTSPTLGSDVASFSIDNPGSPNSALVLSTNGNGSALFATSDISSAGYFLLGNTNNNNPALLAENNAAGPGVSGVAFDGSGVQGSSDNGPGVYGSSFTGVGGSFNSDNDYGLQVTGTHGIKVTASTDGAGINMERGRFIASYTMIGDGDTAPSDVMIVRVVNNGSPDPVTMQFPMNPDDAQMLMTTTDDPDGLDIGAVHIPEGTAVQWVHLGGSWILVQ